jgi:hypothetical protein
MSGSCQGNSEENPTLIFRTDSGGSSSSPPSLSPQSSLIQSTRAHDDLTKEKEEEQRIEWMLNNLSKKDLETAARVSYEYLKNPDTQKRRYYAKSMARLYLQQTQKKHEYHRPHVRALDRMKNTLQFRRDIDMDGLRCAFDDPSSEYQETLQTFLSSQKNYVMCYDRSGRSSHIFVPRKTQKHDPEWTLKESLYTMERAIACSKAPDSSVNVILDFSGFSYLHHSPPFSLGKEFLLAFRHHYVGQIHKIFVLDAPATFSVLWRAFRPFLGTMTKQKIVFCRVMKKKQCILSQHYTPDQAADWMLRNGTKTKELDVQEYLYKTPFDQAFDE